MTWCPTDLGSTLQTVGLYFAHLEQLWRAGADCQGPEQATGALQPPPFPGVWPLVLQPSSDVMQLYNLGSDCCGKSCAGKVIRCFHGKGLSSFAWELHLTSASWFSKPYCRQTCTWLADWMPQLDLGPASSPLVCNRAWFASPDLLCSPCLGTRGLHPSRTGPCLCLPRMTRLTCPGRAACPDLHNAGSKEKEKFNLWSNFGRCNSLIPTEFKNQHIGLRYGTGSKKRGDLDKKHRAWQSTGWTQALSGIRVSFPPLSGSQLCLQVLQLIMLCLDIVIGQTHLLFPFITQICGFQGDSFWSAHSPALHG